MLLLAECNLLLNEPSIVNVTPAIGNNVAAIVK
jgi:hypothetical protein